MDYYSPVLGPKAISIVVEPEGALTCRSSTLTVLADSGPFRVLLLSILGGPRAIFMIDDPGELLLLVHRQHSHVLANSDPFCGLLLTVLGPQSDFHCC